VKAIFGLALCVLLAPKSFAAGDVLFKYKGKAYGPKDLSVVQQQQLYDLRFENYAKTVALIDQLLVDLYVAEEAKKSGRAPEQVEAELFKAADPTDEQIKDFYEKNKHMVPEGYKFEQLTGQIRQYLKELASKEKRDELVAKLRKEKGTEIALTEPVAPVVTINAAGFPTKGKGKLNVVEFADYQCPHCRAASEWLDKILAKHDGKVKLTYVDFPVKGESSQKIAEGAYCAEQQGKFWEYHDLAFKNQEPLHHDKDPVATLAKDLKLDEAKLKACLAGAEAKKRVADGKKEGERLGISGTPSIYINGKRVKAGSAEDLEKEVERHLKGGQS
jgi:protein-disulfide isomerase